MNSILLPVTPTLDERQAAVLSTRTTRDRLQVRREELERGAPTDPLQREQWYAGRADLALLDRDLYRAKGAALKAETELQAARESHYADILRQARPEYQALLQSLAQQLDVAATISAELVGLNADVGLETDGRGFPAGHVWSECFCGVDCKLEQWKRTLRGEGWL